jgi:hypothetical protein
MSVRDALSAVLAAGGSPVSVVDDTGQVVGIATLDLIGRLFADASLPEVAR